MRRCAMAVTRDYSEGRCARENDGRHDPLGVNRLSACSLAVHQMTSRSAAGIAATVAHGSNECARVAYCVPFVAVQARSRVTNAMYRIATSQSRPAFEEGV
jgi:hypothetical protein